MPFLGICRKRIRLKSHFCGRCSLTGSCVARTPADRFCSSLVPLVLFRDRKSRLWPTQVLSSRAGYPVVHELVMLLSMHLCSGKIQLKTMPEYQPQFVMNRGVSPLLNLSNIHNLLGDMKARTTSECLKSWVLDSSGPSQADHKIEIN